MKHPAKQIKTAPKAWQDHLFQIGVVVRPQVSGLFGGSQLLPPQLGRPRSLSLRLGVSQVELMSSNGFTFFGTHQFAVVGCSDRPVPRSLASLLRAGWPGASLKLLTACQGWCQPGPNPVEVSYILVDQGSVAAVDPLEKDRRSVSTSSDFVEDIGWG